MSFIFAECRYSKSYTKRSHHFLALSMLTLFYCTIVEGHIVGLNIIPAAKNMLAYDIIKLHTASDEKETKCLEVWQEVLYFSILSYN